MKSNYIFLKNNEKNLLVNAINNIKTYRMILSEQFFQQMQESFFNSDIFEIKQNYFFKKRLWQKKDGQIPLETLKSLFWKTKNGLCSSEYAFSKYDYFYYVLEARKNQYLMMESLLRMMNNFSDFFIDEKNMNEIIFWQKIPNKVEDFSILCKKH